MNAKNARKYIWHFNDLQFAVESILSRHHCICCLIWDVSHCPNRRFEGWWVHVWWHRNVDLHIVCNTTPEGEQLCQPRPQNQQTQGLKVAKAKTSRYSLLQIVSMCRKSTISISLYPYLYPYLNSLPVPARHDVQKIIQDSAVSCNHFWECARFELRFRFDHIPQTTNWNIFEADTRNWLVENVKTLKWLHFLLRQETRSATASDLDLRQPDTQVQRSSGTERQQRVRKAQQATEFTFHLSTLSLRLSLLKLSASQDLTNPCR